MQRLAVALAVLGLGIVAVRTPGPYVAIGLAIAAIGTGFVGYRRRGAPGHLRLWAAAAITLGILVFVLGTLRIGLTLAAIEHVADLLPGATAT